MSKESVGHLSAFTAYAIFGLNIVVCKDLANSNIFSPTALFSIRALGATLLFWVFSLFFPKEKVPCRDMMKIFAASMLGLYITQTTFLYAITMISPLDSSILSTLTPIFTMIIAAIVLKEPITFKKAGGVLVSFIGVIILILSGVSSKNIIVETKPLGILLIIINIFSFSLYLGIFRPLIKKYSVVTFMKWSFLFSMLLSLPFNVKELVTKDYSVISSSIFFELSFLVIFSTFIAYFLIPIGQQRLRPTVVSMYSYLQPVIASVISIWIGMDVISWEKIIAAAAVVSGVILVNKSKAKVGD